MKEELKKILESSLLEEYLLGLCSDGESRRVEQYIEQYPEVRMEYELLQDNIEQYARQLATPAPVGLKAQVLEEIDRLTAVQAAPPPPPPPPVTPIVEIRRPWWAAAAAIAALIFALGSFLLWQQNSELQTQKLSLQTGFDELKATCEENNRLLASSQQQLEFLQAPGTAKFVLQGNQMASGLSVAAYWNEAQQRNLINVLNLPALPNNQCYQLWADVDGKMLDLGILPNIQDSFKELKYLANATSLNLTIEPEGGSDHPTVSRLVANIFI
ncbi:MAG: anti-sigma factor [Bacteroidota bacterium]